MRIICAIAFVSISCTARVGFELRDGGVRFGDPTSSGDASSAGADSSNGDAPSNGAPTLQPITPVTVDEGAALQFVLAASDPEGDTLTFACTQGCPPGMLVNLTTGAVAYNPQFDHAGVYDASFMVSDPFGSDTESTRITVANVIQYQGWVGLTGAGSFHSVWTAGDIATTGIGEGAFDRPIGIAVDRTGNIYVAEQNNNRVQKLSADGSPLGWLGRKASDGLSTDGWITGDAPLAGSGLGELTEPLGLSLGENDALFVTGGIEDRVQQFDSTGVFATTYGLPGRADGKLHGPMDVAVDSVGNFYVAEQNGNRVQRFSVGGSTAWIGGIYNSSVTDGWSSSSPPSGPGRGDGMFLNPTDVALDSTGNIYVSDWANHRIQKFNNAGQFMGWTGRRASSGLPTNGWISGDGSIEGPNFGMFWQPSGIATTPGDALLVVDSRNVRIQVLDSAGQSTGVFGTSGTGDGAFDGPQDIAVDPSGNIYVTDRYRLNKFDSSYVFVGWIGRKNSDGSVASGWITGDSPVSGTMDGAFSNAEGVAVDDIRNRLFVADDNRVQVFDLTTGVFQISFPVGNATEVAIDALGRAYVTTVWSGRIEVFSTSYVQIATYGTSGTGPGQFARAWGIEISGTDMYVVDNNWTAGGQRLQKWTTSGTFVGWIGKLGPSADTQGWHTGDEAEPSWEPGMFIWPRGLAIDEANDHLYVSDDQRNMISRFVLSTGVFVDRFFPDRYPNYMTIDAGGRLLVTADSGFDIYETPSLTLVDSYGSSGSGDEQFRNAAGIAVLGYDIYIADSFNARIQKW